MSMRKFTPGDPSLAARLKREVRGAVLFDAASRGRYSTDASIYQIEPIGVVGPATAADARARPPGAATPPRQARGRGGAGGGGRRARRLPHRDRGGRAGVAARRRHLAV